MTVETCNTARPASAEASGESAEYRFFREVAADLSAGDVSFPTFLDATVKVRMALKSPTVTAEALARIVMSEPLLSAKVIRLANSAALNPSGKPVTDVRTAVVRIGFGSVRTLAISVAVDQLMQGKEMQPFAAYTRAIWEHSLEVAAMSFVIARKLTRINPHEAMFAGLVHDIGQFYLLYRMARWTELVSDTEALARLMYEWHTSVGHALLSTLGIPEDVVRAVDEHELEFTGIEPRTLAEVIALANRLSERRNPFGRPESDGPVSREQGPRLPAPVIAEMLEESRGEMNSIMAALQV